VTAAEDKASVASGVSKGDDKKDEAKGNTRRLRIYIQEYQE
jgi:hypothetical protein